MTKSQKCGLIGLIAVLFDIVVFLMQWWIVSAILGIIAVTCIELGFYFDRIKK